MAPIILHTFGPIAGVPDPSPFVVKAITLLKMSGLAFVETPSDVRKAPKRKLPYIDDQGTIVADSTFIRMHLERVHGIDFDAGLSSADRALGWTIERMLEEHLYWFIVHERWIVDQSFQRGSARFFDKIPMPVRPIITTIIRRSIQKKLNAQGSGRHDEGQRASLVKGDIDAVATLLGEKPFLFGDKPHGADATMFGFIVNLIGVDWQPKIAALAKPHRNLHAYVDRMMARNFGDMAASG